MKSIKKELFMKSALDYLGLKSKEDLIENIYLKAFIDAYQRISKTSVLEGEIRDRFVKDFEWENSYTTDLIQQQILILTWERWINVSQEEKSRADISLSISGIEFIVECKRLEFSDIKYINDGIKRFVELKYARQDTCAGMIGFVIAGNIDAICNRLKSKVQKFQFTANNDHLLLTNCLDWKRSFQSKHNRNNKTTIHLYHLFFDFIPEKS